VILHGLESISSESPTLKSAVEHVSAFTCGHNASSVEDSFAARRGLLSSSSSRRVASRSVVSRRRTLTGPRTLDARLVTVDVRVNARTLEMDCDAESIVCAS
jgi:hypothetical protein